MPKVYDLSVERDGQPVLALKVRGGTRARDLVALRDRFASEVPNAYTMVVTPRDSGVWLPNTRENQEPEVRIPTHRLLDAVWSTDPPALEGLEGESLEHIFASWMARLTWGDVRTTDPDVRRFVSSTGLLDAVASGEVLYAALYVETNFIIEIVLRQGTA